jgi:cobalt-zinc-cadmium efflux system outer membrane protein
MKPFALIFCLFACLLSSGVSGAEPVTVNSLVLKALATHPELIFYEAQIGVARGDKSTAGQWKNPELLAGVGNWHYKDLGTGYVTDGPTWTAQLTQTFEWPGRLALRKAIAQKSIDLAQLGLQQFRTVLAGRVRTIAWRLLVAQEESRASEEVARRYHSLASVLLQRDPAGAAPRLEARIIQATALTLGADAALARQQLAAARFELNQLLGERPEHPLELKMEHLVLNPPQPLNSLMVHGRQYNFALRARIFDVVQQGYRVELAKNERWPAITVQSFVQNQKALTNETQTGIGVSIPLPLWNRNEGAIEAAKAKQVQAEIMLTTQMRQLERDIAAHESLYRIQVQELAKWPVDILESFRKAAAEADEHYRLGALPLATYTELQRQYIASVKAVLTWQLGAVDARLQLEQLTGVSMAQ